MQSAMSGYVDSRHQSLEDESAQCALPLAGYDETSRGCAASGVVTSDTKTIEIVFGEADDGLRTRAEKAAPSSFPPPAARVI
jgi:hypothetical protein